MTQPEAQLSDAIAAYQLGDRGEALRLCRILLARAPDDAGAHYVMGVAQADAGELHEALRALERAVALAPGRASFHITLGNLYLRLERDAAAAGAFRKALAVAPQSAPAHANLATTLKRQGRLEEAVVEFRAALRLLRAPHPPQGAVTDPSQQETFQFASRAKLAHDIEQYEYLLARGALPPEFAAEIARHREVLAELERNDTSGDAALRHVLSPDQQARLAGSFNRLNYLPPERAWPDAALDPALDSGTPQAEYATADPPLLVIDDFLTGEALAALRRFCLEATIWFDCKEYGGYLGAYLNEGFDSPVLFALARDLKERLPDIFAPHRLAQMWAFKYGSEGTGTRLHADKAAVNLNFWITPDDACADENGGGLRLYDIAAPPEWHFENYNHQETALRAEIARRGATARDIPYKCNRAVIFDSSLIHETIPYRFQEGYENRRINVTMLFGDRAETAN
jgi:hypothetical protein